VALLAPVKLKHSLRGEFFRRSIGLATARPHLTSPHIEPHPSLRKRAAAVVISIGFHTPRFAIAPSTPHSRRRCGDPLLFHSARLIWLQTPFLQRNCFRILDPGSVAPGGAAISGVGFRSRSPSCIFESPDAGTRCGRGDTAERAVSVHPIYISGSGSS
jgi:hypothetical protein